MKIWVLSDLHNEHYEWAPPSIPDADICIAAGDIARGAQEHADWLAYYVRPHMPVISVLGNHEYYRHTIEYENSEAQFSSRRHDIHVLENMTWTYGGVRFVGCTLWTDFYLDNTPERSVRAAAAGMNDFRLIRTKAGRFTPLMSTELHRTSVQFLIETLETPFDGETVVVTHHSPSPRSVAEHYEGDALNAAFSSNLDVIIERYQPAAWIHGHTHTSFDYEIGRTRVICNPRGYGMENHMDFDPAKVIEIGGYQPKPPGF